ncbi:MAG: hypothetical protein AB2693_11370 [Candidatus Thiodiazotropha sp.]
MASQIPGNPDELVSVEPNLFTLNRWREDQSSWKHPLSGQAFEPDFEQGLLQDSLDHTGECRTMWDHASRSDRNNEMG